jgi:hypothetical protein
MAGKGTVQSIPGYVCILFAAKNAKADGLAHGGSPLGFYFNLFLYLAKSYRQRAAIAHILACSILWKREYGKEV